MIKEILNIKSVSQGRFWYIKGYYRFSTNWQLKIRALCKKETTFRRDKYKIKFENRLFKDGVVDYSYNKRFKLGKDRNLLQIFWLIIKIKIYFWVKED